MILALFLAACGSPDDDTAAGKDSAEDSADSGGDSGADSGSDSGGDTADDTGGDTGSSDDQDGDGVPDASDCAPANPARAPGLAEACDYVDNDCDVSTTDLAQTQVTQAYLADGTESGRTELGYDAAFDNVSYRYESPGGFHYYQVNTYVRHVLVESTVDNTGDDAIDIRVLNTLDAEDRIVESVSDTGDDGTYDSGYDVTYRDDGSASFAHWTGSARTVYYRVETDTWGNHVREETDYEYDGTFAVTTIAYTYDGDGHILTMESDTGDDGTVDMYLENDWDGDLVVAQRYDTNLDGTWDIVGAMTYDAEGRSLTTTWDYLDSADYAWTYAYDADGRVVSRTGDYGADGVDDEVATWVYTGDTRYDLTQTVSGTTTTTVGTLTCP